MNTEVMKENGLREPLINIREFAKIVARDVIGESKKVPAIMNDLTEKTVDSGKVLIDAIQQINGAHEKLKPLKKEMIDDLRGLRVATSTEVAAMLQPLKEIRQFLLGVEHEPEVARLKEFVDLCERLQKLKQSGFLDTVADTMLKLA